jgi:hypothetical protein
MLMELDSEKSVLPLHYGVRVVGHDVLHLELVLVKVSTISYSRHLRITPCCLVRLGVCALSKARMVSTERRQDRSLSRRWWRRSEDAILSVDRDCGRLGHA